MRIVILYDNVASPPFREGWGFSALVEIGKRQVLFDCGADRLALAYNAKLLGLDFGTLTDVFLSHPHCDHVGRLSEVLSAAKNTRVWAPSSMRSYLRAQSRGHRVTIVEKPRALGDGLWSTGTMGKALREHELVISGCGQKILLTGCAHPGVDRLALQACALVGTPLSLILGGFHLENASSQRLKSLAECLKPLTGTVAPGHCTGKKATDFLRYSFPKAIPLAVGKRFEWGD